MRPLVVIFQVAILFLVLDGIIAPGPIRRMLDRFHNRHQRKKATETQMTQPKPKTTVHPTTASTKTASNPTAHKPVVSQVQPQQTSNGSAAQPTSHNTHPNNTTAQKPAPPIPAQIVNTPQDKKESEQQPPHTPTVQQPPPPVEAAKLHQSNVKPAETADSAANQATEQHGHPSASPAERENKTVTEGGGGPKDGGKEVGEVGEQKVETPVEVQAQKVAANEETGHKHTAAVPETDSGITGQADAPAHKTGEHTGEAGVPQTVKEETGDHASKPKTQTGDAPAETTAHHTAEKQRGGAGSTPGSDGNATETAAVEAPARK